MVDLVYWFVDGGPVDRDWLDGIINEYNVDCENAISYIQNSEYNWKFSDVVTFIFRDIIDNVVDEYEEEITKYCDIGELKDYLEEKIYHNYSDSRIDVTAEMLEETFDIPEELAEEIVNKLP